MPVPKLVAGRTLGSNARMVDRQRKREPLFSGGAVADATAQLEEPDILVSHNVRPEVSLMLHVFRIKNST